MQYILKFTHDGATFEILFGTLLACQNTMLEIYMRLPMIMTMMCVPA